MKKILIKPKNTFSLLPLLCFVFPILSAFLPSNSINLTAEAAGEEVETKTVIINELIDSENRIHNDYTEFMALSMIDCPEDIVLNVDPWSCTASGELPLPTNIQGLCGGNEFSAETPEGGTLTVMGSLENGDLSVFAFNLTPGTHHIQYMVNDSCDNVFDCEYEVVVPPVNSFITLKQNVVVELSSSSTNGGSVTTINPETIDNGSGNPCIQSKLEIRKNIDLCGIPGNATYNEDGHPNDGDSDPNSIDYDPDGGQSIKFCCEDLTSTLYDIDGDGINDIGYIKVWMRLWEDSDMDGSFGSTGDNYYESWTYVKVEDKLSPAIICPADVTITCDIDYTDLDTTGSAIAEGSCGELGVEYNDIIIDLSTCNEGFVRRRWNVVGRTDIFCDQTITMEDLDVPVTVDFSQVEDFTTANCPDMIALGEPTWVAGPCDVIGYTTDTDTSYFEDGACLTIVNHLTVINWCDYKPSDPSWDGEGIWEHTQVIRVIEETQPILGHCEDMLYEVNDHTDIDNDGELCETMITMTHVATDPGSENCPTGWLKWQVIVDLWADGSDDLEYSSFLPSFDNEFNDTNGNGIPDIYLSPTNSGEEVSIQLPDLVGGFSNHKTSWQVIDGCNNVRSCSIDFLIKDQTSPIAACQDTITVGLSATGPSRLWAINYGSEAMDNCSSTESIRYTFSETPPEDDPSYDPDRRSSNYVLTYYDLAIGSVQLPIYIWDESGNFTTCETVFIIDPNLILNTEEITEVHTNILLQNQPNPFRLSTTVSFSLHRATPVKLTFMNAASAKTLEIEIDGKKGLNTYALDRDLLTGKGLYYYTMSTKYYKETKKMILIH